MADSDGFLIDIFSNEDDFGQIPTTRKVTNKGVSGLSMVSGYATDESDSNSSLKGEDEKKLGTSKYQEDVVDQSVIPMEIEDLEEGECLSDINPAAELEWIYDKEELHKDKMRPAAAVQETPLKPKKKEKSSKKKKKKDKEEKKTEIGKESSKPVRSGSRSHSKERKKHRRSSLESYKGSKKGSVEGKRKPEHSLGRSKDVEEQRHVDGQRSHSSRTPKRDRNRDWSGYEQFRGFPHQHEVGTTKHSSRKHHTPEKVSKQKPKGDRRRVERADSSPDGQWERRVRVVDKGDSSEGDGSHGRKHRHRGEKITVALDERMPKERQKEVKRSEDRRSYHSRKDSSLDFNSDSDFDRSQKLSHSDTSKKREKKNEKGKSKERKVVEEKDGRRDRGRERSAGEERIDVRGLSETMEAKVKHKKRKRSLSESGKNKDKKKKKRKKKKKKKERITEDTAHQSQPADGQKRTTSIVHSSEKRPSISSDMVADKSEGIKDLDLEMRKDRECNTLDQRLQEIERRLALDTDISSDDELPDHHPKLEDIVFSESESREKVNAAEMLPVNLDSLEDSCEAVNGEGLLVEEEEQVANIGNQPLSFEPEEEELSGEALFMKEYGLELEEGSEPEEMHRNREEKEPWSMEEEDKNQGLDEDSGALEVVSSMTDLKPSGFLPGFNLSTQVKNVNGPSAEQKERDKEDHGSSESKWKPVGGFTEVEEVSEEENVATLGSLPPTFVGANDSMVDFGDVSKVRDSKSEQSETVSGGLYESTQTLEEISDQEDIFDSIEQEDVLTKDQPSVSSESKDLQTNVEIEAKKWKPVGLTQVQALSQQLLLTPSDEYCDFNEGDAKVVSPPDEQEDNTKGSSRKKSSSEHKDSNRHRKDHREHEKRHRKTSEKGAKHSKHHETHHHGGDTRSERFYQEEGDSPKGEKHQHSKGITCMPVEAPQKVERTADKYRKKLVRKERSGEGDEKGVGPATAKSERDVRRRSKSKEKEESRSKDRKRQDSEVKVYEVSQDEVEDHTSDTIAQKSSSNERVRDITMADQVTAGAGEDHDNNRSLQKIVPKESGHTIEQKEITKRVATSNDVAKSNEKSKEKKTKRQRSRESESRFQDAERSEPPAVEVRSKKKRRESSRKSKDDLFDDIFGNDGREEEERDAMASLLKEPESFKKTATDYESEGLVERNKTKEKHHHHRKKTEEGKPWKKETRRKRESESANVADSGWKLSKLDSRNEVEKIPGIMDESVPSQTVVSTRETSNDEAGIGIPLLFDSLPKVDVLRSNSEEKENDSSSVFKGSADSWNEGRGEMPAEMSPYNPEDLSPIDLNDSADEDFGLHGDSIAMAIESIEKKRETILANLNYETIMRQKAREHVRQRKTDITHGSGTSEPKPTEQGMVDYLIRQSRVEDEMKTVLKDYYKKKEISKEEYKTILKKAVPQVTMSNSPIIPEKIRNLMKKFVCKAKGQRILNEKKPNTASGSGSASKKKGYYKNFKPPKLPEPKPKDAKDSARKSSAHSSSTGPGTQLKILNPNLPLPPML